MSATGDFYLPAGVSAPEVRSEGVGAPFWEAARRDELVVQRCGACGTFQWGPEWICHHCHSFDVAFEQVLPEGKIFSWERVWQPVSPVLVNACPYLVVQVELPQAGAVRMIGNLLGDAHQHVDIGADVQAVFEHHADFTLVQWRRTTREGLIVTTTDEPIPDFLVDPQRREVHYTLISTDDHVVEPAGIFDGRLEQRYVDAAPKMVELPVGVFKRADGGSPLEVDGPGRWAWMFEEEVIARTGLNAVVGHKSVDKAWREPTSFADMRPGCYDPAARVKDMDIAGVYASVNFPSGLMGFANTRLSRATDRDLGVALTRAWNDWMFEEWHQPFPDRIVPVGVTYLTDPEAAAAEVRRNAERGFVALSFPESPHHAGLPSLHGRGHWDPLLRACEETQTVLCLHVGSGGALPIQPADGPGTAMEVVLFPAHSYIATIDWLWSGVLARFPGLKLAMSEGGIGWVPMLVDRLTYMQTHSSRGAEPGWVDDLDPVERLRENFWFCTLDDPSAMRNLDVVGSDRVTVETDYPHSDSTWPDCQEVVRAMLEAPGLDLTVDQIRDITHRNAARLFRHPLPAEPLP